MKTKSFASGLLPALALAAVFASSAEAHPPGPPTEPRQAALGLGDSLGLSPYWDWKEIETERFRLIFPVELTETAKKAAVLYEQAHAAMHEELRWQPAHKVIVVLVDNADAANGMAAAVGRFGMLLYLTPPETWFSTSYYDDWLKLLIFHEYTHYLNMDATRGLYSGLRMIFGDVLLPNSLWPSWMLEGLAVYMETKYTSMGRGRSPYYEMIVRAAVERGVLGKSEYMTIDQFNGSRPKPPGGEAAYLFGYQMMNEVASHTKGSLSEMTERSSERVPYFINGNVENITGKDFYAHWDSWVEKTNARMGTQLEKIRSQPVTSFDFIEGTRTEALGVAVSPDGNWIAYSQDDEDHWQSLYLRHLKTGETRKIEDKFLGVGLAFTPDSKTVIHSSLRRAGNFNFLSDIKSYELSSGDSRWLTSSSRARDPDVSRDGNWLTYVVAEKSRTTLWIAKISRSGGQTTIIGARPLFGEEALDRVSNPKFSRDQRYVAFSRKKNGTRGEELARVEIKTGLLEVLVSDGAVNRFPAYSPGGELYYVSDRTGVDNLYRHDPVSRAGAQMTNVTTGLWLPALSESGYYASVYTLQGWKIGKFQLPTQAYSSTAATIAPPPAPAEIQSAAPALEPRIEDYSVWSTLAPRQWAPIFLYTARDLYLGAQALGYDATDRHRYLVFGAYDAKLKAGEGLVSYSNRTLGPTLSLYASQSHSNLIYDLNDSPTRFVRENDLGAELSFPFRGTISTLTPALGFSLEREKAHSLIGGDHVTSKARLVPTADASLTYSDTRSSAFSVAPERGRRLFAGVRRYFDHDRPNWKGVAQATEYWHLGGHFVLSPSVRAIGVSRLNRLFLDSNTHLTGRQERIVAPYPGDDFDRAYIRGYPDAIAIVKQAFTFGTDLDFPVWQIFRGLGTNPLFFNQLKMNLFAEATYLPHLSPRYQWLPSAGAGLSLSTELFLNIPVSWNLDYQYGMNERLSDGGDLFFSINLAALPFDF